jgi:hypothetical protein
MRNAYCVRKYKKGDGFAIPLFLLRYIRKGVAKPQTWNSKTRFAQRLKGAEQALLILLCCGGAKAQQQNSETHRHGIAKPQTWNSETRFAQNILTTTLIAVI